MAVVILIASMGSPAVDAGEEHLDAPGVPFIGHSLTSWNGGLETHFAALAASDDPPRALQTERVTAPEYTLEELYRLSMPVSGHALALRDRVKRR
jgi:hypothetical protein